MFRFLTVVFAWTLLLSTMSRADTQELYPDNNVSGRKVVILEARTGAIEGGTSGPVGHAFLKLGTELDNGLVHVHSIFGYYPEHGKLYELKLVTGVQGVIKYDIPSDLQADLSQKYYISDSIYKDIVAYEAGYLGDNPQYSLIAGNNCVKFVAAVAKTAGLIVKDTNALTFPGEVIKLIQKENGTDPNTLEKVKEQRPTHSQPEAHQLSPSGAEDPSRGAAANERSGAEIVQEAIGAGIPVERGGLTPGSAGGNVRIGWPTITLLPH